jgi:signal peptidase I
MKPAASRPATPVWPAARTPSAQSAASGRTARLGLRPSTVAPMILLLAVMVAGWWYLAPPQLGGATSLVTVDGTSMLPGIHPSDIVALRPASHYQVGDVVGYHSQLLHRVVLHRIVAIHNGHYTFKGDNNGFLDPDHPTRSQLVGKRWFQIPSIGRLVGILHTPLVLALLAGLLVLLVALGGRRQPANDQP